MRWKNKEDLFSPVNISPNLFTPGKRTGKVWRDLTSLHSGQCGDLPCRHPGFSPASPWRCIVGFGQSLAWEEGRCWKTSSSAAVYGNIGGPPVCWLVHKRYQNPACSLPPLAPRSGVVSPSSPWWGDFNPCLALGCLPDLTSSKSLSCPHWACRQSSGNAVVLMLLLSSEF